VITLYGMLRPYPGKEVTEIYMDQNAEDEEDFIYIIQRHKYPTTLKAFHPRFIMK